MGALVSLVVAIMSDEDNNSDFDLIAKSVHEDQIDENIDDGKQDSFLKQVQEKIVLPAHFEYIDKNVTSSFLQHILKESDILHLQEAIVTKVRINEMRPRNIEIITYDNLDRPTKIPDAQVEDTLENLCGCRNYVRSNDTNAFLSNTGLCLKQRNKIRKSKMYKEYNLAFTRVYCENHKQKFIGFENEIMKKTLEVLFTNFDHTLSHEQIECLQTLLVADCDLSLLNKREFIYESKSKMSSVYQNEEVLRKLPLWIIQDIISSCDSFLTSNNKYHESFPVKLYTTYRSFLCKDKSYLDSKDKAYKLATIEAKKCSNAVPLRTCISCDAAIKQKKNMTIRARFGYTFEFFSPNTRDKYYATSYTYRSLDHGTVDNDANYTLTPDDFLNLFKLNIPPLILNEPITRKPYYERKLTAIEEQRAKNYSNNHLCTPLIEVNDKILFTTRDDKSYTVEAWCKSSLALYKFYTFFNKRLVRHKSQTQIDIRNDEVLRMTIAGMILETRSILDPSFNNPETCRMNQKSHEPISNCVAKREKFNYALPFAILIVGIFSKEWTADKLFKHWTWRTLVMKYFEALSMPGNMAKNVCSLWTASGSPPSYKIF